MDEKILADLSASYGLTCGAIAPVMGGWLNRKWKVETDRGSVLVKQYSAERYSREKLKPVEDALQRQIILKQKGMPCPGIMLCEGRAIRQQDPDTAYMVMEFCPGAMETPQTITARRMANLGNACGLMHKLFREMPVYSAKGYPIDGAQTLDALWAYYRTRARECPPGAPEAYKAAVRALEPVLKALTVDFFDRQPKGIAHEDLSGDNILFGDKDAPVLLDFDRMQYSYTRHDIGRVLLSFAFDGERLDIEKIRAFAEGYSRHLSLTMPDIASALRITWCIETQWWIGPEYFGENHAKVVRFREEICWLTEHWFELDMMLEK